MAIGVDTSKWKPRKITGTPAAKFRNVFAIGILCFGAISGIIFHFTPVTEGLRKKSEILLEDPIEEVERRMMIAAGMPSRTGDAIRKEMDYAKSLNRPDI